MLLLQAAWAEELKLKATGGQPSLLRALRKAFGFEVLIAGIWKTIWSVFVLVGESVAAVRSTADGACPGHRHVV